MDCIVESAMHSLLGRLKAEYQRELCRAVQEAAGGPERAAGAAAPQRGDGGALRAAAQESATAGGCADAGSFCVEDVTGLKQTKEAAATGWAVSPAHEAVAPAVPSAACANKDAPSGKKGSVRSRQSFEHLRRMEDSIEIEAAWSRRESEEAGRRRGSATSSLATHHRRQVSLGSVESQQSLPALKRLSTNDIEVIEQYRSEQLEKEKKDMQRVAVFRASGTAYNFATLDRDKHWTTHLAFRIVTSRVFDFVMGVIIIVNAVTIGAEASITVRGGEIPIGLRVCEYVLLFIYTAELITRFYAVGVQMALKNKWVRFDTALVCLGFLNFVMMTSSVSSDVVYSLMGNVNILKMLRLARLARTVRAVVQFRTLWLLVQGLMHCVLPMCWTCIIMFCVVYIFAVAGMELIVDASNDPAYLAQAAKFDTIENSMMTLVQFITLDSMAAIYRPLITNIPALAVYFLTFFLLGPIALMNIVTAIMVESSLRTANDDVEARKAWEAMARKQMMPKLRNVFLALDRDGNGEVDLDEIMDAPEEVQEQITRIVDLAELEEVFRLLDVDNSGSVSIDEFVDGILRSQADKPSELIVLMKQGRAILERLDQETVNKFKPTEVPRNTEYPSTPTAPKSTAPLLLDACASAGLPGAPTTAA